ncbi:MAG TPA: hypothetical protein VHX61_00275 [Rhizomicrobium sp.]|jgi:hypothetical protein|nr:hypothetical protein [Rhizomicrobium sp.]
MQKRARKPAIKPAPLPDNTKADIEAAVEGMLETEAMDACARYLGRGRALQHLADNELMACWAAAFRTYCASRKPEDGRRVDDAASELKLRNIEPDKSLIENETRQISDVARQLLIDYPDGHPALKRGVMAYLKRRESQMN